MPEFIQQHGVVIGIGLVYVLVAMVTSLPEKKEDFSLYSWVYHWTHVCINALPARFQPKGSPTDNKEKGI